MSTTGAYIHLCNLLSCNVCILAMCVLTLCMYMFACVHGYTCVTILFTEEYASESYVTTETNKVTSHKNINNE